MHHYYQLNTSRYQYYICLHMSFNILYEDIDVNIYENNILFAERNLTFLLLETTTRSSIPRGRFLGTLQNFQVGF